MLRSIILAFTLIQSIPAYSIECDLSNWDKGLVYLTQTYTKTIDNNIVHIENTGSGVFLSSTYLLTAKHVVDQPGIITISSNNNQFLGRKIWSSNESDIAIVAFARRSDIETVDISKLRYPLNVNDKTISVGYAPSAPVISFGTIADITPPAKNIKAINGFMRTGMSGGPVYSCDKNNLSLRGIMSVIMVAEHNADKIYTGYVELTENDYKTITEFVSI